MFWRPVVVETKRTAVTQALYKTLTHTVAISSFEFFLFLRNTWHMAFEKGTIFILKAVYQLFLPVEACSL